MSSTNPSGSSFAKILLGLDGSSYSQAATEFACQIALKHSAAITGVAVIDLPDIERAIGPAPVGGIHYAEQAEQRLLKQTQEKVQGLLQNFEQVCQSKNINYAVHADTGRPFEEIIEESKYHDFLVLGQKTFFRYNVADEPGDTLDRILTRGLTAVLTVPDQVREIRNVLVAYDDSVQATRTIQMFLLLGIWNQCQITLLNVNEDLNQGNELLDRLRDYFGSYGIEPEKVCLTGKSDAVLLSYINEHNIDLLVMGAYGKTRVVNFFFGSVTKSILEKADIPLFLYH
ncbi:MAG: universal stress protein [Candidatus Poribacteria bacterium]|nr:universal stress protein [Candidatus Poribacteria bacterium]